MAAATCGGGGGGACPGGGSPAASRAHGRTSQSGAEPHRLPRRAVAPAQLRPQVAPRRQLRLSGPRPEQVKGLPPIVRLSFPPHRLPSARQRPAGRAGQPGSCRPIAPRQLPAQVRSRPRRAGIAAGLAAAVAAASVPAAQPGPGQQLPQHAGRARAQCAGSIDGGLAPPRPAPVATGDRHRRLRRDGHWPRRRPDHRRRRRRQPNRAGRNHRRRRPRRA